MLQKRPHVRKEDVGMNAIELVFSFVFGDGDLNEAMVLESAPAQKPRWGELEEEDDGGDYDYLLPPKQVIDEHGIKKVIEYKFNDEGNRVKFTTTTRVRKLANARLSKRAVERRSWPKFGDAVQEDVGARLTMVSTEEIIFERPRAPGTKAEDSNASLAQMSKGGAVLMVCRTCGKKGDHWTSKCPYKDLAQPTENPNPTDSSASGPPGATKGAYVPPTMRPGAVRPTAVADMRRRNDENSVRVNNLSEDTREPDLLELSGQFYFAKSYSPMTPKEHTTRQKSCFLYGWLFVTRTALHSSSQKQNT